MSLGCSEGPRLLMSVCRGDERPVGLEGSEEA